MPRDSWKTGIAAPPAKEPGARFDVGSQNGGMINNVGGDQNVFLPGKAIVVPGGSSARLTPAERAAAVAGLLLFWSGVVLLAVMVYRGAHRLVQDLESSSGASSDWTRYAPHHWGLALTLILVGIVLPRLALRLFGQSAGPG